MKERKRTDKVVLAVLGILCLMCVACTKEITDPYSDYVWTGEYPIKTQNGTTGELEDHIGVIMLQFVNSGIECIVDTGIAGMIGMNRIKFEARWSGKDRFALYRVEKMTLKALNCDSIAATYELSRMPLQE